eukprot:3333492-Lingulodinium_polyedra.AAC.1
MELDDQLLQDIDWGAVQGKRFKSSSAMLADTASTTALVILCLILEPLRCLAGWLTKRASERDEALDSERPATLDLWFLPCSP